MSIISDFSGILTKVLFSKLSSNLYILHFCIIDKILLPTKYNRKRGQRFHPAVIALFQNLRQTEKSVLLSTPPDGYTRSVINNNLTYISFVPYLRIFL